MNVEAAPSLTPQALDILLNGAAALTPDGSPPNLIDPPSLRVPVWLCLGIGLGISTIALVLRSWTKHILMREHHREDYCLLLTWPLFVAFCAVVVRGGQASTSHLYDTRLGAVFVHLYWANVAELLYNVTIVMLKSAILFQYLRVFAPQRHAGRVVFYCSWGAIISCALFYTILGVLTIVQCSPREGIWNMLIPAKCFSVDGILLSSAGFNLVSDIVIVALPLYSIWHLHLPKRDKLRISVIFGLGGIACIATALRLYYTVLIVQTHDITWLLAKIAITAVTEISLGFVCCTLPIMPRLVSKVRSKLSSRHSGVRSYSASSSEATKVSWPTTTSDTMPKVSTIIAGGVDSEIKPPRHPDDGTTVPPSCHRPSQNSMPYSAQHPHSRGDTTQLGDLERGLSVVSSQGSDRTRVSEAHAIIRATQLGYS